MPDYAGDVTAQDAWQILERDPAALLVDVRSEAEWTFVGIPDLSQFGKKPALIAWQSFPGMTLNPEFAGKVESLGLRADAPLLFLCRSGVRSRAAAQTMTARGFSQCFNVAGGFEGDLDGARHRGAMGGWKASGLPWIQT